MYKRFVNVFRGDATVCDLWGVEARVLAMASAGRGGKQGLV